MKVCSSFLMERCQYFKSMFDERWESSGRSLTNHDDLFLLNLPFEAAAV